LYVQTEARRCQLKLRQLQASQPSSDNTEIIAPHSIAELKQSIKVRSSFLSESRPIFRALIESELTLYSSDWP
jgi:hypothetical protein